MFPDISIDWIRANAHLGAAPIIEYCLSNPTKVARVPNTTVCTVYLLEILYSTDMTFVRNTWISFVIKLFYSESFNCAKTNRLKVHNNTAIFNVKMHQMCAKWWMAYSQWISSETLKTCRICRHAMKWLSIFCETIFERSVGAF